MKKVRKKKAPGKETEIVIKPKKWRRLVPPVEEDNEYVKKRK